MQRALFKQMQTIGLWPDGEANQKKLAELAQLGVDDRALARELVQHDLLTPFQANRLIADQGDTLRIGSYVLLERIGEGGMGQVFKAKHHRLHKIVALKVIRPEKLESKVAQERFYREIRAVAKLEHPNIVWAFDADRADRTFYFAMQYIPGPNLSRWVKANGPLPIRLGCDFIRQAALGLQHIADYGMIHRDIKPSNLLLSRAPDSPGSGPIFVKIVDLGLMRVNDAIVEQSAGFGALTQVGAVVGTPDYIAPEQARNAKDADIRSDIYSLGCTAYFTFTGRPPFGGESTVEKIMKHQLDVATPIQTLRAEIPDGLSAIIHTMIAKNPDDRWQQPSEVVDALAPFCDARRKSSPVHARPVAARPVAAKPVEIRPAADENFEFNSQPILAVPSARGYSRHASPLATPWLTIAAVAAVGIVVLFFLLWLIVG